MKQAVLCTEQLEGNLRRFIIFRLLYTARFYYPVFTVLFLDYGLTLEQFAILNIVWALTIVLAEVPSGALADIVGRKRLVVFAASLMVIEMGLIVFAPIGDSSILFFLFLGNRICSGLSEAAASGADEALAYDSLKALGREDDWSKILVRTTHFVSIGFIITMILGAFSYDPGLVNGLISSINSEWQLSANMVMRLPVILTLISSIILLIVTLGFHEIEIEKDENTEVNKLIGKSLLDPFRKILVAGMWTFNHRFVLFVILAALVLDSVGRQFAILASEYYRLIDIPVSWFGFIGAGVSLMGIGSAILSRYLVHNHSPFLNFMMLSGILMLGLIGLGFAIPYYGVIFAVGAFAMMGMVSFQSSYYINKEVDSSHRATVLSFKGLALNLGLGFASFLYTVYVASLRAQQNGELSEVLMREAIFTDALRVFPFYFLVLFIVLVLLGRIFMKPRNAVFIKR
ncbi:MAG: MFS transporter [SAR86 cluster bacterium]|uniref:MFS transporter n=1 Tax=SAR86 cluster bacterium TaxID=2030880 RepID=A0A2A5CF95_9GAMM|nr:MAG: MFS transporter [SAR86 cluster bacterium]